MFQEITNPDSDELRKLLCLTKMGYSEAEASIAMERCGALFLFFLCTLFSLIVGRVSKFQLEMKKDPQKSHIFTCMY